MRARRTALALVALAAAAALVASRTAGPSGMPRLAGLLAMPLPTVTRAAPAPVSVETSDLADAPRAVPHPAAPVSPLVITSAAGRPITPGQPRQLTQDGCCYGAWWSADSEALYTIDRPSDAAQTTIYRLPLWPPGSPAETAETHPPTSAGSEHYLVLPEGDTSTVEDLATGASWQLPTGGNPVRVSPDGSRVVWWDGRGGRGADEAVVRVWGSRIDGSEQKELGGLWGTEVVSFLPDNSRVLVTGRPANDRAVAILATLDVQTGTLTSIARGLWLENALPAPDGARVVYTTSLDREDPAANGVWLASVDGERPVKLPFEGAYRWRDADRLVYVPLEPGAASRRVMQYDVSTGATTALLDPAAVPIRIANNDWSISPDGLTLAWVAEEDRNLWVVDLP